MDQQLDYCCVIPASVGIHLRPGAAITFEPSQRLGIGSLRPVDACLCRHDKVCAAGAAATAVIGATLPFKRKGLLATPFLSFPRKRKSIWLFVVPCGAVQSVLKSQKNPFDTGYRGSSTRFLIGRMAFYTAPSGGAEVAHRLLRVVGRGERQGS